MNRPSLRTSLFAVAILIASHSTVFAGNTNFTGSYLQNFDSLGTAGTTMPPGFRAMGIAGGNGTFSNGVPVTATAIAGATAAASQTLTVWNTGTAAFRVQDGLANTGSWGNNNDRGLGSGPTGDAATVIELAMTNSTGSNLNGVVFSYDMKVLTNGSAGTEASELPGYAFLYSLTGSTTPADWLPVSALSLTNSTQNSTNSSGSVAINFPSPLANGGVMYFRWADDNNVASSPDQTLAIDNINVNSVGNALQFDGINDYVTFGAAPGIGVSNFTVECWFKRQGAGATASTGTGGVTAVPLVTKGRGEADGSNVDCNFFLGIGTNNALTADFEDFNSGLNHPITGTTPVSSNVWQHAAVTYDVASGTWTMYLNGVPNATNVISGAALVRTPRYDSIQHASLASALTSTGAPQGFFNGVIDEVRIWNYARSSNEISDNYLSELTNNPAGLVARWSLNNGPAATCTNSIGGGVSGTLTNGPLWVSGYPFGTIINQQPTVAITNPAANATFSEGASVSIGAIANDPDGSVTNVAFLVDGVKIADVTNAPFSTTWPATFGAHTLTAIATDNQGASNVSTAVNISVTPAPGVGGLFFDGANDYVTFGPAPGLGVSNFTVECWFKRQGAGASTSTGTGGVTAFPLVTKGRAESDGSSVDCNFFLGINGANNALAADFEDFNNGLNHPVVGTTPIGSNVWQHAAVTYDSASGTWVLYLNGVPDVTNVISGTALVKTPRYDSIQHAALASALTSTGAAAGFFAGRLDEVRVWNYARTAGQIAGAMNLQIGSSPGLIGRWGLNEASGAVANDSTASGVNGTLTNGPIWVDGYPFPPQSNAPPSVAIIAPTNGLTIDAPATFAVTAAASDIEGTVTNVEFFSNGSSVGSLTSLPYSVVLSNLSTGSYDLTAVATDNEGLSATSAVVTVTVAVPNLTPTVTAVISPTNGATDVVKSPTLSVQVSDPEGASNLTVTFYGRVAGPAPGEDFTLIALPDTQFYSETFSNVFFAQTDWILSNRAALKIPYVAQLGDCVQNGDHGGNDNEWKNATNALYRLENPVTTTLPDGIPYGVAVGNHDQGATGNGIATDTTIFYNQYFGTNHFLPYAYYGGNYATNNDNHFDLFSAGGMDFIAIYFEYDTTLTSTNAPIFTWANGLLQTYSNRRAIIVSHWIMNSGTGGTFSAQGQTIYDALKAHTNLFLMLCGHVNPNGEGRRSDTFNGNTVWTLLSDYQDLANGGNGWLRTYQFSPSNNVIHAKTYSPWLDQSQTGNSSQFDVPYTMTPTNAYVVIGTVSNIASGDIASVTWAGLKSNTTYEWYATVSDGHSTGTGPVSQFTTSTNLPLVPPAVTLTAPTNNASYEAPAAIVLSANPTDPDGLITNVAFYNGTNKLADVANAPFTFNWNGVPAGTYALTAVCSDDDGLTATSDVVNITVTNSAAVTILQQAKTVIVIAMENHNFTQPNPASSPQQILSNAAAPYINSLLTPGHSNAVQVSYATRYYNAGIGVHPSEPSYVWAEAGTDFGVHTDNDPSAGSGNLFTAPHLTAQLNTAGIPWKNYQEDVQMGAGPTHSASGTSATVINPYYGTGQYNYAVKHNPMAFFTDTQLQNVYPFTQFLQDLGSNNIGRYNWITPNQFNDQHSALSAGFTYLGTHYTGDQAGIAQGDNFLATLIPQIMASQAYKDNGVIIIWWDESEGGDNTSFTIPEIVISPLAKGNAYASSVEMSHSSDIKTMEEIFGLPFLSNAIPASETRAAGSGYNNVATVNDLSDMFRAVAHVGVQQFGGSNIANSATVAFGTTNPGSSISMTLTLTNRGIAMLNVTNVAVTGSNPADFVVNEFSAPTTVTPGSSVNLEVVFTPSVAGLRSATLQIQSDDPIDGNFVINLTGNGNATPVVVVSSNLTVEATGPGGAIVNFSTSASDTEDGVLTPLSAPASGDLFPIGTNIVTVTATDSGGLSATNNFTVIVQDTTPPEIQWTFTNVVLGTGSNCIVSMPDLTGTNYIVASDIVSGAALTIEQQPPAATPLAAGSSNLVLITVRDAFGNSVVSTNSIIVIDGAAPTIIAQPVSRTNDVGSSAVFSAGAIACSTVTFQWYFGSNAIPGQTNSTLVIDPVKQADAGEYHVLVTGSGGVTNSDPATLTVTVQPPQILSGQMLPDGTFQLIFSAPEGQTYEVLGAGDVLTVPEEWEVLDTGTFGSTNAVYIDTNATNFTARYYRIKTQ